MTTFLFSLVRHGETEANKERIIQGQRDVPLSSVGRSQASRLGARFSLEPVTCAYSSDLQRARETLDIVLSCSQCGFKITEDPRLRERHFGDFQGKPFSVLVSEARKNHLSTVDFTPRNAETYEQVKQRAAELFSHVCSVESEREHTKPIVSPLLSKYAGERTGPVPVTSHVLVSTHGGVVRSLLDHFETDFGCRLPGDGRLTTPNTALSSFVVTTSNGKCTSIVCLCVHDKTHLSS